MKLIVGLGNPEEEYSRTRHNMGFDVINALAKQENIQIKNKKFNALVGDSIFQNEKVILLKPQTYMNLSGQAIRDTMQFYKINASDIIVVYDDMDIEPGKIKIRKQGSAGSHNGMKSVIQEVGTQNFIRIRIGIGRPIYSGDKINFVLQPIPSQEYEILQKGINKAKDAIIEILKNGIDIAMNKYN